MFHTAEVRTTRFAQQKERLMSVKRRMIMRLIDADALIEEALTEGAYGYVDALQIANAPTVDAVPVSELKKLRDYLYAEDLIFMRGLAELNKLIANYGKNKKED